VAAEAAEAAKAEESRGYRFGDLFLNKITGKDKYEFGDLTKWLGNTLQEKACEVTGKDSYEFGDLSRHLDARAKEEACKLTGKANYEFGDLTKELGRRIQEGEISAEELSLLLRALLTFGAGLTPVAHLLPVKLLLDLLAWNVQADMTARAAGAVTGAIAAEVDRRAKLALLGRESYALGDLTREQLSRSLRTYTGKDEYEFGDVTRAVLGHFDDGGSGAGGAASVPSPKR